MFHVPLLGVPLMLHGANYLTSLVVLVVSVHSTVVVCSIYVAWRQLPHLVGRTCSGRSIYHCLIFLVIVGVLFTVSGLGASCMLYCYGRRVSCCM